MHLNRRARVPVLVLLGTLLAACAGHHSTTARVTHTPVDVSGAIARGCFRCLEQAYNDAGHDNATQAFEAAILLALRAKELGIPFDGWLTRARTLAAGDERRSVYLEVAAAVPEDPRSGDRDVIFRTTLSPVELAENARGWRDALATAPGSVAFREYVMLTLACLVDSREDAVASVDNALKQYADVPLVRFRAGLCRTNGPSVLAELRQAVPEFVDADYPLGLSALSERPRPDYDVALDRLMSAAQAFPQSPVIATALGDLRQLREEWSEALVAYDRVIALVPTHRDALLGRTIALSRVMRHDEAIAAATRLIDLGGWYVGQALYWRAWNALALDRIESARADADRAKTQMVNAAVFLVSGLIERRSGRLESAEHEFEQAQSMDHSACDAPFYLGTVRAERGLLDRARTPLVEADACFVNVIAALRRRIDEINAGRGSADVKGRLVAAQQSAVDEAQTRVDEARRLMSEIAARLKTP